MEQVLQQSVSQTALTDRVSHDDENHVNSHDRAMYNGFGTAFARGIEISLTTVLFTLFGLWLDGRFDTKPVFTLVFSTLAIFGLAARAYYGYNAEMAREEAGTSWTRKR